MNLTLIILILCTLYQTLEAGSSSSYTSPPIPCTEVALDLKKFASSELTFLNNILPANLDLANDIKDKVAEFNTMNGIQEYLSLPALYGQYIQMFSIWNEQYMNQAAYVSAMDTHKPSADNANKTIIFCRSDLDSLISAFTMFAEGNLASRQAVVDTIVNFVSSTSTKGFTVTADSLEYLKKDAVKIDTSLLAISQGFQESIYALDMMISVINGSYRYQKSDDAIDFLTHFADFKANLQDRMNNVYSQFDIANNAFFNLDSAAFTMYTLYFKDFYNTYNDAQRVIARNFKEITNVGNTFTAQIIGAPSSSLSSN